MIPAERPVGASGDLTALSCLAAVLFGEREVLFDGRRMPAAQALAEVGQQRVAARLRADRTSETPSRNDARLQDRPSRRCAPHVIGVFEDALPCLRQQVENELDGANDNPLIDAENGRVLHGGHCHGGHIAVAMDALRTWVAR